MEIELAEKEESEFVNIASTRQLDQAFNRTPGGKYSARLNATEGKAIGPGLPINVKAPIGAEVTSVPPFYLNRSKLFHFIFY
jgi:hypothetical protein